MDRYPFIIRGQGDFARDCERNYYRNHRSSLNNNRSFHSSSSRSTREQQWDMLAMERLMCIDEMMGRCRALEEQLELILMMRQCRAFGGGFPHHSANTAYVMNAILQKHYELEAQRQLLEKREEELAATEGSLREELNKLRSELEEVRRASESNSRTGGSNTQGTAPASRTPKQSFPDPGPASFDPVGEPDPRTGGPSTHRPPPQSFPFAGSAGFNPAGTNFGRQGYFPGGVAFGYKSDNISYRGEAEEIFSQPPASPGRHARDAAAARPAPEQQYNPFSCPQRAGDAGAARPAPEQLYNPFFGPQRGGDAGPQRPGAQNDDNEEIPEAVKQWLKRKGFKHK